MATSILKVLLQAKLNSAKLDLATHFIVVMVDVTEGSLKVKFDTFQLVFILVIILVYILVYILVFILVYRLVNH